MRLILLIYRALYCAFLTIMVAGLVRNIRLGDAVIISDLIPYCLFICTLVFTIVATVTFHRIPKSLIWIATSLLCLFFVWYGWYSLDSPFVLHETHTFDVAEAAAEISRHRIRGTIGNVILGLWLLSFPLIRHFHDQCAKK